MKKESRKIEVKPSLKGTWNKFARCLIEAKKSWEEHQELWAETPTSEIEKLPVEFQKFLTKSFNRSSFEVLLPRLVDYYRAYGGIETLVVKIHKEEKE